MAGLHAFARSSILLEGSTDIDRSLSMGCGGRGKCHGRHKEKFSSSSHLLPQKATPSDFSVGFPKKLALALPAHTFPSSVIAQSAGALACLCLQSGGEPLLAKVRVFGKKCREMLPEVEWSTSPPPAL